MRSPDVTCKICRGSYPLLPPRHPSLPPEGGIGCCPRCVDKIHRRVRNDLLIMLQGVIHQGSITIEDIRDKIFKAISEEEISNLRIMYKGDLK